MGLTQVLVETLTLVIAALILLRLPAVRKRHQAQPFHRAWSFFLAVISGGVVAGLLMAVNQYEVDRTITAFYEQASYLEAHGRNIVNVILVDFRSLDTLGEIIVVAAAALSALTLIRTKGADL